VALKSESHHQHRGHADGRVLEDGGRTPGMTLGSLLPTPASRDHKGADHRRVSLENATKSRGDGGASSLADVACLLPTPTARDYKGESNTPGRTRDGRPRGEGDDTLPDTIAKAKWGRYGAAIDRWKAISGPVPTPTETAKSGKPRLNPAFSEWMMGWPDGWVTDPAVGISRVEQLRIIGNGVCPQQAHAAIRYLLSMSEVAA
jgi:DNA (cytosine-5)-methyltransferase 1